MAPIVAPCLQVAVKGSNLLGTWANVFHVQELGAEPPDTVTAATAVLDAYCDHIMPMISSSWTCSSADFADLSSLSGLSGSVVPTGGAQIGGGDGIACPPNTCILVTWPALGTRAQRNGRTYLGGIPEAITTSDGLITEGAVTSWTNAMTDFVEALQLADLSVCVLSKSGAAAGSVRSALNPLVSQLLATQRRRLRP